MRAGVRACVRACVYVCVCVSLVGDSSETVEVSIVLLGTVTASDMRMHHVLSMLTFIQGHTYLNHEKNECLIISEAIQAMPIKFSVKIVQSDQGSI